jgi:hypothetical protein
MIGDVGEQAAQFLSIGTKHLIACHLQINKTPTAVRTQFINLLISTLYNFGEGLFIGIADIQHERINATANDLDFWHNNTKKDSFLELSVPSYEVLH